MRPISTQIYNFIQIKVELHPTIHNVQATINLCIN